MTNLPTFEPRLTYATEGEDIIIAQLLREVKQGFYIDIGANHPINYSNTYTLYQKGWRGIGIDGNADYHSAWCAHRPGDVFITALLSNEKRNVFFSIFEDPTMASMDLKTVERYKSRFAVGPNLRTLASTTLSNLLIDKNLSIPDDVHLLNIDVEREDERVLLGCDLETLLPGVIVVETKILSLHNPSSHPIFQLLTGIGYKLISKTPLDSFFILPSKSYLAWIPSALYDQ